jgi:ATP-dependent DNA ligase
LVEHIEGDGGVEHIPGSGATIFKLACLMSLEGIVSKRRDHP